MRKLGWALALVLIGACNTTSTSSLSIDELPAKLVESQCKAAVHCGAFPDMATCQATMDTAATTVPLTASVKAGTVKYNGQSAAICVDGIQHLMTMCKQSAQGRLQLPPACDNMFIGTVALGGACRHDQECVSGSCDRSACADSCCAGTCVVAAVVTAATPAGTACASNDQCVTGTFCPTGDGPHVCTALIASGQPCNLSAECVIGTACITTPTSNGSLVCADPPQRGEPCSGPGVCDSPTQFCDLAVLTCQDRLTVGAACDPTADGCVPYAFCDASGACAARGGVGAACAPAPAANTCLAGLTCAGGACAVPAAPVCP